MTEDIKVVQDENGNNVIQISNTTITTQTYTKEQLTQIIHDIQNRINDYNDKLKYYNELLSKL